MEPGDFACCLGSSIMGRKWFLWPLLGDFFRCQTLLEVGTVVNIGGIGREVLHKMLPVRYVWFCGMNLPSIGTVLPLFVFKFHGYFLVHGVQC